MTAVRGCGQPIPIFGGFVGRPAWIVDQQCIGRIVVAACSSTSRRMNFGSTAVVAVAFWWMTHTGSFLCSLRSEVRCSNPKRVSECGSRDALESNRTKTASTTQTQREREPQTQLWNVGATLRRLCGVTTKPNTVYPAPKRLETRNFSWRSFYQSRCIERDTRLLVVVILCRHERRG